MKKLLPLLLALTMVMSLSACGGTSSSTKESAAPATSPAADASSGVSAVPLDLSQNIYDILNSTDINCKIGIMSTSVSQSEEAYRTAVRVQKKFGEDKVIIDTFPANAVSEQETSISKVMAMASDPDVKAIVFNQANDGTIAAVKKLKESRDDIISIACNPNEDYDEVASVVDVVLVKDQLGLGRQFAQMAIDMGAKNFVHYSFPRHMSNQNIAARCELMKKICTDAGVNFIEATAPDPQSDAGVAGTQQFILEDVPRKIKELGEDTVFFSTNTAMHEAIIKCVVAGHAMYVGQSDPTPFDAFPAALGIQVPEDKIGDGEYMIAAIQEKVDAANMNGRISTWSYSSNMMYTEAGSLYAMLRGTGLVNASSGDEALAALQSCYKTVAGDGAQVSYWTNNEGKTYDHVFQVIGSQHVFE